MKTIDAFLQHFETLPDPRQSWKVRYPLNEILLLSLCAMLCGCDSFSDMVAYGQSKLDFLKQLLPFKNGIPSHDTLGLVLSMMNPKVFAHLFSQWTHSLRQGIGEIIAIDGKRLRHSFDADHPAIHMVSAWASTQRLALAQVKVGDKTNEITAIATQIVAQGGDYMLALKGNQGGLLEDVSSFIDAQEKEVFRHSCVDHYETLEKGHGRVEQRRYGSCDDVAWLHERFPAWSSIRSVAWVSFFSGRIGWKILSQSEGLYPRRGAKRPE